VYWAALVTFGRRHAMPATVIIGGQWGDEGKGRVVDLLARDAQVIARYSAGHNAGHTVINHLGEFHLSIVPAGIFYPGKTCVIGNGAVVDPATLLAEIEQLRTRGVSTEHLHISDRAHVVMPYHPALDRLDEGLRGPLAVGTTGRGVGPAFGDKVGRMGIRMADLIDGPAFKQRLRHVLDYKNAVLTKLYDADPFDYETVYHEYREFGQQLAPYTADTASLVQQELDRGEKVLLEGAQGALLDLDFGSYEYVTSAVPSSSAAGAALGIGIGPNEITRVIGVYKAYQTRVGNGPMPTELFDEEGERLRENGQEYGTVTGRPRRCGWFDAVAARYSARVNGVQHAVFTRLDVLDRFRSIQFCTAYETGAGRVETFPASARLLDECRPVLESMPGWETETTSAREFDDLPQAAQNYVRRIESLIGCPIDLVSVGPERDQCIQIRPII
jgi:adenylosuccinate synthase